MVMKWNSEQTERPGLVGVAARYVAGHWEDNCPWNAFWRPQAVDTLLGHLFLSHEAGGHLANALKAWAREYVSTPQAHATLEPGEGDNPAGVSQLVQASVLWGFRPGYHDKVNYPLAMVYDLPTGEAVVAWNSDQASVVCWPTHEAFYAVSVRPMADRQLVGVPLTHVMATTVLQAKSCIRSVLKLHPLGQELIGQPFPVRAPAEAQV